MKTPEFWRCLNLRNPILHQTKISANSLTHRPIFNLSRLIFYKFHENRVRFLESVVRRVMMSGEHWPEPRRLLKLMSDLVMKIEMDGQIQFDVISNHVFYEIGKNTETLGLLHNLRFSTNSIQPGLQYDLSLSILACEESEHLLGTVFQFGLLRLLPEGAKEFLNTWILEVRRKLRKQFMNRRFEMKMVEEFSINGQKPLLIPLKNERFEEFLCARIGKILNTNELKTYGGKWREYAMQTIRSFQVPIFESFDTFFAFAVSDCNAKRTAN